MNSSTVTRIIEVSASAVLLLLVGLLVVFAVTGDHLLLVLLVGVLAIVGQPLAAVGFGLFTSGNDR